MSNPPPRDPGELRRQAEARLGKRHTDGSAATGGEEDAAQILHELRVHQIELEMQNEELRCAQAELEAGRARFFDLYDLAPVGYFTVSEQGLILEANLTSASLLSTARGTLVKQPLSHFIVKDDQDIYYLHRKKLMETGKAQDFELRLVRPDGTFFWAHLTANAAEAEDGAPLCRVALSDITERLRSGEALKASEARFKELLQGVPTLAVQGYSLDGTVRYWNRASETFYGYTAEEALGQNLLDLIIPLHLQEAVRAAIRGIVETGQPVPASELELLRKDGSLIPVYSSHALVHLPGQQAELFCLDVDLSERKRAEAEKARLQAQFQQAQKMESVGRLAGGVAHDFNNLLMGIMGYVHFCRQSVGPDHPIVEWLNEIKKAAQRSASLTRQLLAFARKQTIAPQILDLDEAVSGMISLLHQLIGEDIALSWSPGGNLWPVKVDPSQIDQILANLVVNARDAIGGVGHLGIATGMVAVTPEDCAQLPEAAPGEYVVLSVSDDGCGMDRETLNHIFEPFFTTKASGQGTGLGLATVYGIVKQNGGFIHVHSEPGKGATFQVHLPRCQEPAEIETAIPPCTTASGGTETILLVEDEKGVRVTVALFLEMEGYTVLSAADPEEAISLAERHSGSIELLVTDVVMPAMNGRDLATRLTADRPDMKCLFMSGYSADVIAHRGILEEGVHFLAKPFTREVIARKVREVLNGGVSSTTGKAGPR